MKSLLSLLAIIISTSLSFSTIYAQDKATDKERMTISVETDPSTFAFGGYAAHVRIKLKNCQHLVWGAGAYAMNFPSFLVDMNADNKGKGWGVRINSAVSLFGEYYFKEANNKWFAGLQVGVQNYKLTNSHSTNKATYSNLLVMPSIGYTWRPFNFPLYFKPWLGVGYMNKIAGSNTLEGSTYKLSPIMPFVTLHVGYTF